MEGWINATRILFRINQIQSNLQSYIDQLLRIEKMIERPLSDWVRDYKAHEDNVKKNWSNKTDKILSK